MSHSKGENGRISKVDSWNKAELLEGLAMRSSVTEPGSKHKIQKAISVMSLFVFYTSKKSRTVCAMG